MKIITLLAAISISLLSLALSCKKTVSTNTPLQKTNATLKRNETFYHNFGLIGMEDGMRITQQAKHFEISRLERDSTGKLVYTYKPTAGYTGKDEVEITHYISAGGPPIGSARTRFLFTVTE